MASSLAELRKPALPWTPVDTSRSRPCLAAPRSLLTGALLLLLPEVGILTFLVEIPPGPLEYVVSGWVCAALLFALAAFLLLSAHDLSVVPVCRPRSRAAVLFWLLAHLGFCAIFFSFTLWLAGTGRHLTPWLLLPSWLLLAGGVGLSALLVFFPARQLASWVWGLRGKILTAAGLALGYALVMPLVQSLWPRVCGPALALDRWLLAHGYGLGVSGWAADGSPVLGTRRLLLRVTPQCSEVEAVVGFWLLAAALLVARFRELRPVRVAFVLILGTGLIYLLLALRLCGLVAVGLRYSPAVCVSLAHSRISGILFLGLAIALLSGTCRWCLRPTNPTLSLPRTGWRGERSAALN